MLNCIYAINPNSPKRLGLNQPKPLRRHQRPPETSSRSNPPPRCISSISAPPTPSARSQPHIVPRGRTKLLLITQAPRPPHCLASRFTRQYSGILGYRPPPINPKLREALHKTSVYISSPMQYSPFHEMHLPNYTQRRHRCRLQTMQRMSAYSTNGKSISSAT